MTKQTLPISLKLLLSIAGITLIGYLIFSHFNNSSLDAHNLATEIVGASQESGRPREIETSHPAENGRSALMSTKKEGISLPSAASTTYRPGITRWRRPIEGNMAKMIYDADTKNFWLYAQSEKDAQWLDQYGYPTPDEHTRLTEASDFELENLAQIGDLNAKVHLAARAAKKAYATISDKEIIKAHEAQIETLFGGGPYQAVVVAKSFKEMARQFQRLSVAEQTPERRAVIQRFSDVQEEASVITKLYGDDLGKASAAVMNNEAKSKYLGLEERPNLSGDDVIAMIVNGVMRWRDSNKLPPLVIVPRPSEIDVAEKIIERY